MYGAAGSSSPYSPVIQITAALASGSSMRFRQRFRDGNTGGWCVWCEGEGGESTDSKLDDDDYKVRLSIHLTKR